MTLQPQPILPVPEHTATVARAAFPKGNTYLQLRDELGTIYDDALFATFYPHDGQPALRPWRLALVTVLQFAENLPDHQAADVVRSRIDWKYLLGLELTDPGFDYSVLCEFRARLISGDATDLLLDRMLQLLQQHGILKHRGRQRTDSTYIVAAVRDLSRLELVGATLLHALNTRAIVAPDWLQRVVPTAWAHRYTQRWEEYRLPTTESERLARATQVGQDGCLLLAAVYAPDAPAWVRHVPVVDTLRRVWIQTTQAEQVACVRNAARHLEPGGRLVIELWIPDLRRFPPGLPALPFTVSPSHLGFDELDVATQQGVSHHYFIEGDHVTRFDSPYRYVWPSELDLMAQLAGLTLDERWADWDRSPFTSDSRKHISVWSRARA